MHRLFKSTTFRIVLGVVIGIGFISATFALTVSIESKAILKRKLQEQSLNLAIASATAKKSTTATKTATKKSTTSASSNSFPDCQKVTDTEPSTPQVDSSNPGVTESTSYNYYSVYGNTPNDIFSQTQKCGPDTSEGVFEGSTDYRIRWSYRYSWQDQTNCKVSAVAVGVSVRINLPKWEQPDGASQSTIDYWNESIGNLKNHEATHRQIAIDGAGKIQQALQDLPAQNCSQIEQNAEARAMGVFEEVKASQSDFDARTNHGAN